MACGHCDFAAGALALSAEGAALRRSVREGALAPQLGGLFLGAGAAGREHRDRAAAARRGHRVADRLELGHLGRGEPVEQRRAHLRDVLNTFSGWRPGMTNDPDQPFWTWTPTCHVALQGGYVIEIKKQPNGSLRWDQITPQFQKVPLPPGEPVPSDFASCPMFFPG